MCYQKFVCVQSFMNKAMGGGSGGGGGFSFTNYNKTITLTNYLIPITNKVSV